MLGGHVIGVRSSTSSGRDCRQHLVAESAPPRTTQQMLRKDAANTAPLIQSVSAVDASQKNRAPLMTSVGLFLSRTFAAAPTARWPM